MRTRKRFGQHFLEPAWADKVVASIAPSSDDVVLEIGAGPGILTLRLAPHVAALIAVEIDRDLVRTLAPRLPPNASIVSGNVLDIDLPAVLATAAVPVRVVGNLPYNISSPILSKVVELTKHRPVRDATLMLQREVANRIIATPGTADYGVLSILLQWYADITKVLTLPPGAFRPPPAVHSSVIRLTFRPPPGLVDQQLFERMVRRMFMQRRKTLANSLTAFGAEINVPAGDALRQAGLDPARRPETLEIVEIARLADVFAAARS